jgi:cation transport ATPase
MAGDGINDAPAWPRRMSVLLWEPETDVAIQSAGLTLIGTPSGVTRSAR